MNASKASRSLPHRAINPNVTDPSGSEVILIEALQVRAGDVVALRFEAASQARRHGVWLATEGVLSIEDEEASQFVVWSDTAPPTVDIGVVLTDGWLRLYNIWTSSSGPGYRSQSDYSGMLRRDRVDGWIEYSCSDIGLPPSFDQLVFSVKLPAEADDLLSESLGFPGRFRF
jgi:hypothetical protein